MSQTEPEFVANHEFTIKTLNGYYHVNKNIPSKVLKYSFTVISNDGIISDPNVDDELLFKTLLFNRGYVAAASNHAEGFHRQLKSIANLNLGIEHNIEKLIYQICKRYEKYQNGKSGKKVCDKIKNDLLEKQTKYKIEPVEECS